MRSTNTYGVWHPLRTHGVRHLMRNASKSMPDPILITIDGPAGVGKSTAAKQLALRLGLAYLDTGATYRALAYAALHADVNPGDVTRLAAMARRLPLRLSPDAAGRLRVLWRGCDITRQIRTEEVSEAAAQVSQHPEVRKVMVELQRRLASAARPAPGSTAVGRGGPRRGARDGVVVEGRDSGSVVFPDATHKFFLTARPAIRARRRQRELAKLYGAGPPLAQVKEQLHFRDGLDRTRRVGPLVKPHGAIALDTSNRTIAQVIRTMLTHVRQTSRRGLPASP